MDQVDAKLIMILQENGRLPLKQIAEMVYLSSPAVSARIDSLEKQGIIKGYRAIVDTEKLGYPITAFINLEMNPKQKPTFYSYIEKCPNVLECNNVTGMYSMLMKAVFKNTAELDAFIGQLQKYGTTSTQIVFSTCVHPRGIDISQNGI